MNGHFIYDAASDLCEEGYDCWKDIEVDDAFTCHHDKRHNKSKSKCSFSKTYPRRDLNPEDRPWIAFKTAPPSYEKYLLQFMEQELGIKVQENLTSRKSLQQRNLSHHS